MLAVFCYGDGGVPCLLNLFAKFLQGLVGADVGVGRDKARLVHFYVGNHRGLVGDCLRAVDEADSAFLGKRDGHFVV